MLSACRPFLPAPVLLVALLPASNTLRCGGLRQLPVGGCGGWWLRGGPQTACNTCPLECLPRHLHLTRGGVAGLHQPSTGRPSGAPSALVNPSSGIVGPSPKILGGARPDRPERDVRASLAQLGVSSKGTAPECRQPAICAEGSACCPGLSAAARRPTCLPPPRCYTPAAPLVGCHPLGPR